MISAVLFQMLSDRRLDVSQSLPSSRSVLSSVTAAVAPSSKVVIQHINTTQRNNTTRVAINLVSSSTHGQLNYCKLCHFLEGETILDFLPLLIQETNLTIER